MADSLLSVKVVDDAGKSKTVPVFFTSSVTPANIQTFATDFIPLLDATIDGMITEATVTLDITVPGGIKASPVVDSTVRRGAVESFANPSRFNWSLYIPSFSLALITGGNIDITDAAVIALNAAYVTGAGGFTPSNGLGLDLTAFLRAAESFRK